MSNPSKYPPDAAGGKKIPAATPSSAYGPKPSAEGAAAPIPLPEKAKPPVVTPAGLPGQVPATGQPAFPQTSFPPPGSGPGYFPPKPAPPVPRPRNTKGLGLIIGIVVAIPICLLLACGVGGYLIVSGAKKAVTTAANKVKEENAKQQNKRNQNNQFKVDPNDPFAALNSPQVQKEMEKAFDKMGEEMKKQADANQKGNRPRPGSKTKNNSSNSGPPNGLPGGNPFPSNPANSRPEEKEDYPTNLKRLLTGNEGEKQRAAEWFARQSLDSQKQEEVSKALNNMHTDALRKHAVGALKVWGTKENVPMIAKIMQQEAFVKIDCMDMLEKFRDERAIEPLIATLNEAFREGERAEEILGDWWPEAEQPLIKHLHDKEGRVRERTQRILELRKTEQSLLITQTLEDIKSPNREVRRSAVDWLAKLDVNADLQSQVASAVQPLLGDSNNDVRRHAVEMFAKYAGKDQADELLKLLDEKEHEKWKAGLTGLVRLGDVRAAERIGRRKELRGEAFVLFRQTGKPAEDLVQKTLTQIEVKDWGAGKELCEILGEIGSSKSVGFLQQVKKKATANKTPFVPEAADKAIESIRRRN